MATYEVRRKLVDTTNGYVLPRGAFVKTTELAWVRRFGSDLKLNEIIPSGVVPFEVANTVEQASVSSKVTETKPRFNTKPKKEEEEIQMPEVRRIPTRGEHRAVLGEFTDDK